MIAAALTALVTAWALAATCFTLVALVRVRTSPGVVPADAPAVLLVRPLDAPTALERANLATPIAYAGALEHVVLSPTEPAGLPDAVRWIASDPSSANRKVGHLLAALAAVQVRGRVVLAIDADVRVDGALVRALAGPLGQGVALTTAAPEPLPAHGLAAIATRALLRNTHHSFVALDAVRAGAPSPCGKALGLGAAALRELDALDAFLGEDLELGRRLHARGERVVLVRTRARVPQADDTPWRTPLERFARWMQVLRAHRAPLFPTVPLLLAPSLPLLVAALALVASSRIPAAAVALLFVARTALARRLGARGAMAWPLGEALLLAAWTVSLGRGDRVVWRGAVFRVARGGRLARDARTEPLR